MDDWSESCAVLFKITIPSRAFKVRTAYCTLELPLLFSYFLHIILMTLDFKVICQSNEFFISNLKKISIWDAEAETYSRFELVTKITPHPV